MAPFERLVRISSAGISTNILRGLHLVDTKSQPCLHVNLQSTRSRLYPTEQMAALPKDLPNR
jgi:hypothetical protein